MGQTRQGQGWWGTEDKPGKRHTTRVKRKQEEHGGQTRGDMRACSVLHMWQQLKFLSLNGRPWEQAAGVRNGPRVPACMSTCSCPPHACNKLLFQSGVGFAADIDPQQSVCMTWTGAETIRLQQTILSFQKITALRNVRPQLIAAVPAGTSGRRFLDTADHDRLRPFVRVLALSNPIAALFNQPRQIHPTTHTTDVLQEQAQSHI